MILVDSDLFELLESPPSVTDEGDTVLVDIDVVTDVGKDEIGILLVSIPVYI